MRVQLKLLEMGVHVMLPVGHDHPFDMVAYHAGEFSRIQVKTARDGRDKDRKTNGTVLIPTYSTVDRKGGKFTKLLTKEDCDVVVAYYPRHQTFYVVPPGKHVWMLWYSDYRHTANSRSFDAVDFEFNNVQQLFPHVRAASAWESAPARPDDRFPTERILPLFQEIAS